MHKKLALSLALAVGVFACGVVVAAELKSGPPVGESPDPFDVVKCGGAVNDGVKVGEELCYRCKHSKHPTVMVFARKVDDKLVALVKKLDEELAEHADKKLAAFVCLLGEDAEALKAAAKDFAAKHKIEHVALTVPVENLNGPESYGINPEAETTILVYSNLKIKSNHALAAGELDDKTIGVLTEEVDKIVE